MPKFRFRYILNFAVLIISCAHILSIYKQSVDPPLPNVKHYEQNLNRIEFPLIFKFCFLHRELVYFLKDLGYDGILNFYHGQSRYNSSLYGWNGHTLNGRTKGSVKSKMNNIRKVRLN